MNRNLIKKSRCKWMALGFVLILLLSVVLYGCAAPPARNPQDTGEIKDHVEIASVSKNLDQYDITVDFKPDSKTLSCAQRLDYTNRENTPLKELYFHLYPNAHKYENKAPFAKEEMTEAYPNGFSSGFLEIRSIRVDGKKASYALEGTSEELLKITLPKKLLPGKKALVEMTYMVKVPNSLGRFGYGEYTYNITNWYPIAAVYDEEGWHKDPYYAIGDPFYSDAANYRLTITAPKEQTIASSGNILDSKLEGDKRKWRIEARAVRDFAWLSSDRFEVATKDVGRTRVYSYYFSKNSGRKALDYGADSIRIFNELFGEYPYRQFSVIEADFFIGGMEYPNIVLIDKGLYTGSTRKWLEFVTVHEAAHQWWYGLVGNNEVDEAWLDEALTEYSTILYYGKKYDQDFQNRMFQDMVVNQSYGRLQVLEQGSKEPEVIEKPVHQFKNMWVYDSLVYGKGAMMFQELHRQLGDEDFFKSLQLYFDRMKYKNAKKTDLIAAFDDATGKKWGSFFDQWLYGKKANP